MVAVCGFHGVVWIATKLNDEKHEQDSDGRSGPFAGPIVC